ncbi:MAG TPA: LacI family transcriptional regulator, partial [Planococcus sp. (in: firmicutes)]|nr:LacI family transcriptional regulator [Planococcus sp. (in: firmicutes)]
WVASAAVDPMDIGRIQVRYAYQLINGEKPEEKVVLDPVFVDAEKLPAQAITTNELSESIEGWGASEQGYTDALKELEGN